MPVAPTGAMRFALQRQVVVRRRRWFWWLVPLAVAGGIAQLFLVGAALRVVTELRPVHVIERPAQVIRTTVAPSVAHAWLDQPETLGHARIVPMVRQGQPAGFKLYAIRADSPLAVIGFRNGDVVQRIDGEDLSNPDAVLTLYQRMRDERPSRIVIELERQGHPVTILLSVG